MQVTCPACKHVIPPDDINTQAGIAKCSACNEVFNCAGEAGGNPSAAPAPVKDFVNRVVQSLGDAPPPPAKTDVPMPRGFTMAQQGTDQVITRRWFSGMAILMLLLSLMGAALITAGWIFILHQREMPWQVYIFYCCFAGGVLLFLYYALANLCNTTVLRVNDRTLRVAHGPLWWPGNRTFAVDTIVQLYCVKNVSYSSGGSGGGHFSITYDVNVLSRSGDRSSLVSGLNKPEHARFIEQEIEKRLGIVDRLVDGEMYAP